MVYDVPEPTNPDAVLISACTEFDVLSSHFDRIYADADPGDPDADGLADPIEKRMAGLIECICGGPAQSLPGVRARALTLSRWDAELADEGGRDGPWSRRILRALLGDLLSDAPLNKADH